MIELNTIARHPKRERGDHPCIACGKPTRGVLWVHLRTDGHLVPTDATVDEPYDQGWHPIGPDCARKLPADYVARLKRARRMPHAQPGES